MGSGTVQMIHGRLILTMYTVLDQNERQGHGNDLVLTYLLIFKQN